MSGKGLTIRHGQGFADRFVVFEGNMSAVNAAIGLLTYIPSRDFNSVQHVELLTITVWQIASTEAKVRQDH